MNCSDKIRSHLTGDAAEVDRRARILADLCAALEHGGVEAATDLLAKPMTELERAFETKLQDLEQLF
jgi:hypothetical protein